MLISLISAFAVGLAAAVATLAIPFVLGLFDRRDIPDPGATMRLCRSSGPRRRGGGGPSPTSS